MGPTILHYADVETGFDTPERLGRLTTALSEPSDAIVVGSGDVLAPSVLAMLYDTDHAAPFYDTVAPSVETFGNHDFDVGVGTLRQFVESCPTDWISANVFDGPHRFAGVEPWNLVQRGDSTVGIVGVTDPDTSVPNRLRVEDPVTATASAITQLRDEVEYLVVSVHGNVDIAREIATLDGVDVILTGHRHTVDVDEVDGTPVVYPGANGEVVQQVSLGGSVEVTTRDVSAVARNRAVERELEALKADAGLLETVTTVSEPVRCDREACLDGPCRVLGTVAAAYRWAGEADVGVVDTRALRDRPPLDGAVRAFDLVSLVPFAGRIRVCELSGADLESLVAGAIRSDDGYRERAAGESDWMAQFAGVDIDVAPSGDVSALTVGGSPVAADEQYRVATNPYVVGTDTEFDAIDTEDVVDCERMQYEAVVDYVRAHGFTTPGGGDVA